MAEIQRSDHPGPPQRIAGDGDLPAQLLYFTGPSLTADGRHLFFIRETGGHPNVHAVDLRTGTETAVSANREGTLLSYVYFRGTPYRGLSRASVSLDPKRKVAYYLQGRHLCRADLAGEVTVVAELPDGQVTAFTHVSADGKRICVPTTDARALEDGAPGAGSSEHQVAGAPNEVISEKPAYDIDERVRREGLNSWLRVYDTRNGAELASERVPRAWVTHVQFSPVRTDWILYNHEWPSECGIRRLWLWDGREHRRLRTEGPGRSRDDWACHEMWQRDGQFIIYHGKFADGRPFIGRVSPAGGEPIEISLPAAYRRYGHFTAGTTHSNWLVSDGYWHPAGEPEDGRWGGEWITRLRVDWPARRIDWTPLCRHESRWDCQDSHPHPVFSPGDREVYFTSNAGGGRGVSRIGVPG